MEKIVCSIAFRDYTWKPGHSRHPIVFYELDDYLIEVNHKPPTPLELIRLLPDLFEEFGARTYILRDASTRKKLWWIHCSKYINKYPVQNPLKREKMLEYSLRNKNSSYRIIDDTWIHEKNLTKKPNPPPLTRFQVEWLLKHEGELFRLRCESELKRKNI